MRLFSFSPSTLFRTVRNSLGGWIAAERRMSLSELDEMMDRSFMGGPTSSGVNVHAGSALTLSAVFCAVRLLAESIGSLPLFVLQRDAKGNRERLTRHALYAVLHHQANAEQTAMEFRETLQGHLELRGNAYAEIVRDGGEQVRELWPLHPDLVAPKRQDDGSLVYAVRVKNGAQTIYLPERKVLHLRGLGSNGVTGFSTITMMAEMLGLGLGAQEYAARFFSNDGTPGGVLQMDGKLSEVAQKRLKEFFTAQHGGLSNRHRTAILEEGLKWQTIGISAKDAQILESRKFSITEVARMFNIPAHKLKDLEHATFTNIEHQNIEFVVDAIRPRCVRWEQRLSAALLSAEDRAAGVFIEHQVDGLLRGDFATRMAGYAVGRNGGWFSVNDIRRLENMNSIENGDIYLQPLNYQEAGQAPVEPPTTTKPARREEDFDRDVNDAIARLSLTKAGGV